MKKLCFMFYLVLCMTAMCFVSFAENSSTAITSTGLTFPDGFILSSITSPVYGYVAVTGTESGRSSYVLFIVSAGEFKISNNSRGTLYQYGKYWYASVAPYGNFNPFDDVQKITSTGKCTYLGEKDRSFKVTDLLDKPDFDIGTGEFFNPVKYDTSIPAPQNLKFTSIGSGGFLGINKDYKHSLTWTNSFKEDLQARISVQYKYTTSDGIPQYDDYVLSSSFSAKSGSWIQNVDDIKKAIMKESYSSLNALNQYRVQFYKVVDGVEYVGPVGVVHLNKTIMGDYTGSTVTTEKPVDPEIPGDGMDSFDDGWTSEGEDYVDYDKDGNVTGGGTSGGDITGTGDPLKWVITQLGNIPKIFSSFFMSLQGLMSGVSQVPSYIASVFSFLPAEIMTLIGLGVGVVVILRIFGR